MNDYETLVGLRLVIDGDTYLVLEYDAPTGQFGILRAGADACEFVVATRLVSNIRRGLVTVVARQLALAGMEG